MPIAPVTVRCHKILGYFFRPRPEPRLNKRRSRSQTGASQGHEQPRAPTPVRSGTASSAGGVRKRLGRRRSSLSALGAAPLRWLGSGTVLVVSWALRGLVPAKTCGWVGRSESGLFRSVRQAARRCSCDFLFFPLGLWFPGLRVQALRRGKRGLRGVRDSSHTSTTACGWQGDSCEWRPASTLLGAARRPGGKAREAALCKRWPSASVVDTAVRARRAPYQVRGTSSKIQNTRGPLFRRLLLRAWLQAKQGMDSSAVRVCEVLLVFAMRHLRQTGRRRASGVLRRPPRAGS